MKRFHRALISSSLLISYLLPSILVAAESRYFVRIERERSLSDILHELDIGRIYGKGRLLEATVRMNPKKESTRGDLIYRGDRIYIPLSDPSKLPPAFQILESGEIVRVSTPVAPAKVEKPKTAAPLPPPPAPAVVKPAPVKAAPKNEKPVRPIKTVNEPQRDPRRKYWLQAGYGQRTATETIGNVKTVMEGLSVLPEVGAGIHFYLEDGWFSGLSASASNPQTFLNVDMPILYSVELYGGRERVARLGENSAWSPGAIVRYGSDIHITPNASSGTASSVSYLGRETRALEIGMKNCLRFSASADGTSFCLDVTRILSKNPQEQVNRLALSKLAGWGFRGIFLLPLNQRRTWQAALEGSYTQSSSGAHALRSFGGLVGLRYNFFD